jgi:hypothetical protein
MDHRWESIVRVAREIQDSFGGGRVPDQAVAMRLARSVLDFQQRLVGASVKPRPMPRPSPARSLAACASASAPRAEPADGDAAAA